MHTESAPPERSPTITASMREVADAPPDARPQALRDAEARLTGLARVGLLDVAQVAAAVREMAENLDASSWRAHVADAKNLRSRQFAPIQHIVPGLIPDGLTLLASRPKLGKSWLVLDLCIACAAGDVTLGTVRPPQGDVLYLALEDTARRLQRRMARLRPGADDAWPERLTFATDWRRTDAGGLLDIAAWCGSVPSPRLVVVDTLEKIRPLASGLFGSSDHRALAGLHDLASARGLAIVVVHHDRKQGSDDPLDTVRGTLALVGAADTVLVLKRRAGGPVLYARGRDIEESEAAARFDKTSCKWTLLGPAADVHRSDERARIVAALAQAGGPLAIRDIQARADLPSRSAADTLLFRMVESGEIERAGRGVYGLRPEKGGCGGEAAGALPGELG